MISKKANDAFWESVTVPIEKGLTIRLVGSDIVLEKKQESKKETEKIGRESVC